MNTRKKHLFLSIFGGKVVAVGGFSLLAANKSRNGNFALSRDFWRIRKRPEKLLISGKRRIDFILKSMELTFQIIRLFKHIADHLNLILAKITVNMRVTDKRMRRLRQRTV